MGTPPTARERRTDLPHVTDILSEAGLVETRWFTEFARDRGTAVHLATELDDLGTLDESTVDPTNVAPRLAAYRKFITEMKPEILAIEEPVEYRGSYCGTLDRRMVINGKECVVDIKNGGPAPWHAIQLMLYALCFPQPLKRFGLYLLDDKYTLVEYTDGRDRGVALAVLTLTSWRRERGI